MTGSGRRWSILACFLGATGIVLGSVLPYAPASLCDPSTCRIIAPPLVSLMGWLPSATPPLVAIVIAVVLGIRLVKQEKPDHYVAGFLTGVGILMIAFFLVFGIRFGYPGRFGVIGPGGVVGMIGGAFVLASGILETTLTRRPVADPMDPPPDQDPP